MRDIHYSIIRQCELGAGHELEPHAVEMDACDPRARLIWRDDVPLPPFTKWSEAGASESLAGDELAPAGLDPADPKPTDPEGPDKSGLS